MYELPSTREPATLALLFPPRAVALLDLFRTLGDFEARYDASILDRLEAQLGEFLDPMTAKGVVSDALLLAFGLRRERGARLDLSELGSRRGTADEYRLLALIGAALEDDGERAAAAATALEVANFRPLAALAADFARRLEEAGFELALPDGRLLVSNECGAARLIGAGPRPMRPRLVEH